MKSQFKQLIARALPGSYSERVPGRPNPIAVALAAQNGYRVMNGPFAGLNYTHKAAGSALAPKLVGSYERELHPIWGKILKNSYDVVIDIGCAEGYYAVGLAKYLPNAPHVIAFDMDAEARLLCRELSIKNGVSDRVEVLGECDVAALGRALENRSLVICDCEGAEVDLLNIEQIPALAQADILVELHDFLRAGVTSTLKERFSNSHEIQWIDSEKPDPSLYPSLEILTPEQRAIALDERAEPMQWAWMMPKLK